eukprot:g5662.t1
MMEIRRLAALLVLGWGGAHGATTSTAAASSAAASSAMDSSSSGSVSASADLAPVTMMNSGSFHTVVIIRDSMVNVVKNWGANGKGQLGLNDTKDRGDNDGDVGDLLPAVSLGTGLEAVDVTAGLRHTAAIMSDGSVRSWGYNRKGQLGVASIFDVGDEPDEMGDNMFETPLGDVTPVSIIAGGWHTCAIVDDDNLKCWGYNQWGELGLEDQNDRGDEPNEMGNNLPLVDLGDDAKVLSVACGDWHTCVLLDDGDVKCFGKNYAGQLGYDDTENRGDDEGEMGDNLDIVDLGGKKATKIAAGEEHTCAILEGGDLVCWGLGSSGQLGQGGVQNIGDDGGDMSNLAPINLGTGRTAVEVAAGGNHTCAILDNSDVKCWGENDYGELGMGDTITRGVSPTQMGDQLLPVSLPAGWTLRSLSLGYYHTCAIVSEVGSGDRVVCWGANFSGQIGLGDSETEHTGDEPDEMGEALAPANLGGDFVEESDEKWYEKTWFYIACGVVGAVLLCCLCLLCRQAHGDTSGRGPPKQYAARTGLEQTKKSPMPAPGSQETPNGSSDSTHGAVGPKTSGAPRSGATGGMVGPRPSVPPAKTGAQNA